MKESLETRAAALAAHAAVLKPEGPGPFPVTLQFHGCGGVKSQQWAYGEAARAAGWAAVIIDSYAHRGIGRARAYATVCTGLSLWGRERAGDVYAALAWARAQGWADPSQLALAGWSHGGWAVLDALAMSAPAARRATRLDVPDDVLAGVASVFLVYPYAGVGCVAALKGWRIRPRGAAIVCARDRVVGRRAPLRVLERLRGDGAPIEINTYDATHAFDEPEARDVRSRHDPVLTARATARYAELLASSRVLVSGSRATARNPQ